MLVTRLKKTNWLVVLQLEFRLNTTLYYFKKFYHLSNQSIEQVKPKNKFICVAMCSLVMSLCSRDALTIIEKQ